MAYNIEQRLQEWLRHNYTPEVFRIGRMSELTESMLTQIAIDWDWSHKQSHPMTWYKAVAKEAIDRFINNREGKTQGDDDRGHRFGKSSAFT